MHPMSAPDATGTSPRRSREEGCSPGTQCWKQRVEIDFQQGRSGAARSDDSDGEDEDDADDSAIEEAMNLDGLEPQFFGHARSSGSKDRKTDGDEGEADFEPESFQRLVSSLQDTLARQARFVNGGHLHRGRKR